uniref:Translation initiation factor IF-2, chloroplastic n=1 Tax=Bostrychia moritziana TaxID=103713 RepID=A0A1Z1M7C6_BOSMO|nr:translation initiation factor 2 [Bostrychia moritziana]ARW61665.1 translation initiation factor 2 [Bostrychia moritziana]
MRYIFLYDFCLSELSCQIFFNCNYNLSSTYSNNILKLESPKLLYFIKSSILSSSSLLKNQETKESFTDKVNTKPNPVSKFDKKYRNNIDTQDILEVKKNKLRLNKNKKNRKSEVDIDQEDIFTHSDNIFFDQKDLNLSSLKNHKVNKVKKKDKSRQEIIDTYRKELLPSDNIETSPSNIHKNVIISTPLSIQELSNKLSIPEAEIITYLFLKQGISVTVNQVIDVSIAQQVASSYDFNVTNKDFHNKFSLKEKNISIRSSDHSLRAPVVTIMGHVDHGKTTLLDTILETNLVHQERGGITQSISAYEIDWEYNLKSYKLIFLDTPGHEAFESMRIRGVQITDIVLLVVAADDGLQPQTIECIEYIQQTNLPFVVVINKIDKKDVNISRITQDLAKYNIISKQLGGDTEIIHVSALKRKNIDLLLSQVCLLSDQARFFADPMELARGTIIEAYLDRKQGSVANVIVQNGTLNLGDFIVSSNVYGKVKGILNLKDIRLTSAGPSSIVKVLGFSAVPEIGLEFKAVKNEKQAKQDSISYSGSEYLKTALKLLNNRITSSYYSHIKQLKLIIKTDTQGTLEAVINLLSKLPQSKVQLNIISANFTGISNSDIELALSTNSFLIAFNLNISSQIYNLIKKNNIIFENFYVIYDLMNYVENLMLDLVELEYDKLFVGSATVRTVFEIQKKFVAGCFINQGKIKKICYIHVCRNNHIVYEGNIISLKHLKEDVNEVYSGDECGLMCEYNSWKSLDIVEAYELVPKKKSLL